MSNPGVKILAKSSNKKSKIKRFVLEDNIGESIHLHMDNIRIDFTIKEFLHFSDIVKESLINLNILDGFEIKQFDIHFLKNCSKYLHKIVKIKKEKIKIKDLLCVTHYKWNNVIIEKIKKINKTPIFNYLKSDDQEYVNYPQFNYLNIDNKERVKSLIDSIKDYGYPYDNQYIILFNGQNIIRDGQHRAAILAHLYGENFEIEILRFYFKDNEHFLSFFKGNIKKIIISFLKEIRKKLKIKLKRY
jgi:hypothetical protein